MSRLDRKKLKRMIINEMNMMGMTDMPAIGDMSSLVSDETMPDMGFAGDDMPHEHHSSMSAAKGMLSKEQCCAAIMCLIECCSCPNTKNKIMAMCESVMNGEDSSFHSM